MNLIDSVEVRIETSQGSIDVVVYLRKVPASAGAFLHFIDKGIFTAHGEFYRAVRSSQNDHGHPAIDVIQGGWRNPPDSLIRLSHEPTTMTGLRHIDGTLSLARGAHNTATGAEFFICIGDQPALDHGGLRHRDLQGFAAFGQVMDGMGTVRIIHQSPTGGATADSYRHGQMLEPPVRILRAFRK